MSSSPAERVLDAHLRYLRHLTVASGGRISETAESVAFCSPHPFPALVNVAAPIDASASLDAVFEQAATFFATHDRSAYEVMGLDGRDDELLRAGRDRGLEVDESSQPLQLLSHPIDSGLRPSPAGTTVRWVTDESDAAVVTEVARLAHQVYRFPDDLFPTLFAAPGVVLAPDLGVAIVEFEGRPVATAQIHLGTGTGYLGWVAAVPDAGRSGFGGLATAECVEKAFTSGASEVALMASPMGAPLYRRLGFEDVGGVRGVAVKA